MTTRREIQTVDTAPDIFSAIFSPAPLFYAICIFYFLFLSPSPLFFLCHSLIYRVDNSSLSDIQWQVRNARKTEWKLFTIKRVGQPVFTFDDQKRKSRREKEREREGGGKKVKNGFSNIAEWSRIPAPRVKFISFRRASAASINRSLDIHSILNVNRPKITNASPPDGNGALCESMNIHDKIDTHSVRDLNRRSPVDRVYLA